MMTRQHRPVSLRAPSVSSIELERVLPPPFADAPLPIPPCPSNCLLCSPPSFCSIACRQKLPQCSSGAPVAPAQNAVGELRPAIASNAPVTVAAAPPAAAATGDAGDPLLFLSICSFPPFDLSISRSFYLSIFRCFDLSIALSPFFFCLSLSLSHSLSCVLPNPGQPLSIYNSCLMRATSPNVSSHLCQADVS